MYIKKTKQGYKFFKDGGEVSPEKAREILHDGTVHGYPLTDKQRRYFGAMSSKKQVGGEMENNEIPDADDMERNEYKKGGSKMKTPKNKGFKALPKYVQKHILANMKQEGGPQVFDYPVFDSASFMKEGGQPGYHCGGPFMHFLQRGGQSMLPDYGMIMGENLPMFYMQAGGQFTGASKVTEVPSDFQFAGTEGSKKYYTKHVQAPGAVIPSPGSNTPAPDPEKHKQFLIKQLQSGVTPEDLIQAGHASPGGIDSLRGYYTPKIVYTEPTQTPANVPTNIPLSESDRLEMKQIFPPSGGKYLTFQVPDVNAGYTKATEQYYDPTTFRQIDPTKSFDPSGSYSPSYLFEDPSKGLLSEKYRGTKTSTRIDPTKIGKADTTNVNPTIMKSVSGAGYQFGGSNLNKFMSNYMKKFGGFQSPQGQSTDDVLTQKNKDFVDYIANNTKAAFFRDEADLFNRGFAQLGQEVENQPSYLPPKTTQFPANTQDPSLMFDPHFAQNNQLLNQGQNAFNQIPSEDNQTRNNQIADLSMAGARGINNLFNQYYANKQNKFNQNKMTIENTAGTSFGSRGDYDVNSGVFRPNQYTPPTYKNGGQYNVNQDEVLRMIQEGYDFIILEG